MEAQIRCPENCQPNVLVNAETKLRNETEYGALGIYLGRILKEEIPAIQGIDKDRDKLKQLSAAIATTGMTNMFKIGLTSQKTTEKITVETKDLKGTVEELSTAKDKKPDLVFIGCPHCSIKEMRKIAKAVKGKKVKSGIEFWVCTSCHVGEETSEYIRQIEKCGGHVLTGVCTVVSFTEKLGIKTMMTNSAKTAYYAPTLSKAEATLAPIEQCLKTALKS